MVERIGAMSDRLLSLVVPKAQASATQCSRAQVRVSAPNSRVVVVTPANFQSVG